MLLYFVFMFFVIFTLVQAARNMGKTEEIIVPPAGVIVVGVVSLIFYWMHWVYFSIGITHNSWFYVVMTLLAIYYLLIILRFATCKVYKWTVTPQVW